MINLLPNNTKNDIQAARENVILSRYIAIIVLAIIFILILFATSKIILTQTMETAQSRIETSSTKADTYSATQQQISELSDKLSDAKSLLDNDVRYSVILTTIAQNTPEGVVIKKLSLDTSIINGSPLEIIAYARSNTEASLLQTQFQSSGIFTQVSLKQTDASSGISGYPVAVTLSVTINKKAAQ